MQKFEETVRRTRGPGIHEVLQARKIETKVRGGAGNGTQKQRQCSIQNVLWITSILHQHDCENVIIQCEGYVLFARAFKQASVECLPIRDHNIFVTFGTLVYTCRKFISSQCCASLYVCEALCLRSITSIELVPMGSETGHG